MQTLHKRLSHALASGKTVIQIAQVIRTVDEAVTVFDLSQSSRLRQAAVFSLSRTCTTENVHIVVSVLQKSAGDDSPQVRWETYRTFGKLANFFDPNLLFPGIIDPRIEVSIAAVEALANFTSADAKSKLTEVAFKPFQPDGDSDDTDVFYASRVRAASIRSLGKLQAKEYSEQILVAITSQDETIRLAAVECVKLWKLVEAIVPLRDLIITKPQDKHLIVYLRALRQIAKSPIDLQMAAELLRSYSVGLWYKSSAIQCESIMGYCEVYGYPAFSQFVAEDFSNEMPSFLFWKLPLFLLWLGQFPIVRIVTIWVVRAAIEIEFYL